MVKCDAPVSPDCQAPNLPTCDPPLLPKTKSPCLLKKNVPLLPKCPAPVWPHDRYVNKVLIDNWFENRSEYVKTPHDFKTIYNVDYYQKKGDNLEPFVWDQRDKWRGLDARILYDHDSPHFLENFSTTYDLSFRHYPKSYDGPIPRVLRMRLERYDPETDYAKNHGNVTCYGLVDAKKEQWRCESMVPRRTLTSQYQDYYTSPKHEKIKSWGIPS
ncbi:hypothetical protein FQR65_LT14332 [Abscondita terminalis]|nr:hypothetical protein FQR65_LT14332 [Abscondita terminalis]